MLTAVSVSASAAHDKDMKKGDQVKYFPVLSISAALSRFVFLETLPGRPTENQKPLTEF